MTSASEPQIRRVLVSVDFADPSIEAARWVADYFAPSAELILAHIIEPPPATRSNVIRYPSVETIVSRAHIDVQKRLEELCKSISPVRARPEIRVGWPHDELVQLAESTGADLIVVGRQDLGSSGWARIGATAQRVLRKSPVPILLVTGVPDHAPDNLLIAVDESEITSKVIGWGAYLAEKFSAKASVLHAAGVEPSPDDDEWMDDEIGRVMSGSTLARRITREAMRPAESIIAEAKKMETELIVIGSRGAGAANQLLFGSVAESVLLSSPCPVLVVLPGAWLNSPI